MTDDGYRVYFMPFAGDIKAVLRLDQEGYPSIYINDALSPAAKKRAFMHEMRHIMRDDMYSDRPTEEVEKSADSDMREDQLIHLEDAEP